jgi:prephenate dehydrogenase
MGMVTVCIIGVGLIGGSMALALKENGIAQKVIGVGRSASSIAKAIELGIIDEALPLEEAVKQSDLIYVSIPVDATIPVMQQVMDLITDKQIVVDAGSTKFALCDALKDHPDAQTVCGNASNVGYRIQWSRSRGKRRFCRKSLRDMRKGKD